MAELVKRTRDKVIVRPRGELNHAGKLIQSLGVSMALAAVPLGIWVNDRFLVLGIVAAALVVAGLPMVLIGKRTVLDVAARNVLLATGDVVPFDQIADVDLRTYVHEVSRQQGTVQHQRFRVALVHKGADPDHADRIDKARRRIETAVAEPYGRLDTQEHRALSAELATIQQAAPAGEPVVFADHADELKMWRVAERVAKTLDVPIVDYCGDELVVRTPGELDVPLGERLARLGVHEPDEGPTPDGLCDRSSGERILVSWGWPVWGGAAAMFVLGGAFAVLGYLIWEDMPEIRVAFGAVGVALVAFGLFLADGRRKGVEVDRRSARFRSGAWVRRSRRIALEDLEMVRVNKTLGSSLSLISDDRVLRCPMPSGDAADWTRLRIVRYLVAGALARQTSPSATGAPDKDPELR